MNNSESTKLFSGFYHSRDLCATGFEGICLTCRLWGRLSLQTHGGTGVVWVKEYANRDEETWAFEDDGEYRVDDHGVAYSLDGHRLLFSRFSFTSEEYVVPDGVVTICSMAFAMCRQFVTLSIPRSVRLIGDFVFGPGGGKIIIRDN